MKNSRVQLFARDTVRNHQIQVKIKIWTLASYNMELTCMAAAQDPYNHVYSVTSCYCSTLISPPEMRKRGLFFVL